MDDLYRQIETKEEYKSTRDGYGAALLELGAINESIIVLTADLPDSTRTIGFKKAFPERFFDCGVAEQNMASVSAGLALSGYTPFCSSFAAFSPGRNWDQIRVSIAYSKANVKIASSHSGLGTGEDGASHQALEDIALMRVLPNMRVIVPCDYEETRKATHLAARLQGPVYIRFSRQNVRSYIDPSFPFEEGKALTLKKGTDLTLLNTGITLQYCLEAMHILTDMGINVELIHIPWVKPIDKEAILQSVSKTHAFISVEDHQVAGGFGSAVLECFNEAPFTPLFTMVGMNDSFGESGDYKQLFQKYGISVENIVEKAKQLVARK